MGKYFYFWREDSPFSNFNTHAPFIYKGNTFTNSEQAFMYMKSLEFKDLESTHKILLETSPKQVKKLGRGVKNYDDKIWTEKREAIMKDILRTKFSVPYYRNKLLKTGDAELVEASPFDRIWGIGLASSDSRSKSKDTWLGQNLLGKILTEIKDEIKEKTTT